jgi:hypothetical protein
MTTAEQRDLIEASRAQNGSEIVYVTIIIGGRERQYVLYVTAAPKAYDYEWSTIPVQESDGVRWLLLDEDNEARQVTRYASGLYPAIHSKDMTTDGITTLLWRKVVA